MSAIPYIGWFLIGLLFLLWGLFGIFKVPVSPDMMTLAYAMAIVAGISVCFGGYWLGWRRVP